MARMSPAVRHRVMASIGKRDTAPELALRSTLWAAGIRGWRCHAKLPGTPDLVFSRWRVAVFVDGVWWHGRADYLPRGRRGKYWDEKIAKNKARDRAVNRTLRAMGWRVVRIWDLDVIADPMRASQRVVTALRAAGWEQRVLVLPSAPSMPEYLRIELKAVNKLVAEPPPSSWSVSENLP